MGKIRGSIKDPFLYFGVLAVILLGIVIFVPPLLSNRSVVLTTENFRYIVGLGQTSTEAVFTSQADVKKSESPDFSIIQDNSLAASSMPLVISPSILGSLVGDSSGRGNEIIEYEVQQGDTLQSIAGQFDVSLNTLLWANNLTNKSSAKVGQKLIILPVSGVLYYVKSGDNLGDIAKKYKGDQNEIIMFNEISDPSEITIGDILIIPNGTIPASAPASTAYSYTVVTSNYFICPIAAPCRVTQGLHFYNAVDLSHGTGGEPIYAAAGGIVTSVSSGWNSGAGNTIKILHPNGVATSYGHLQSFAVKKGDVVSQGQIIGYMGGKPGTPGAGISTGYHVHFAVYGAKNPFAR